MKFKTCVENAREELIKALEFVKGIKEKKQTNAITKANDAIKTIDSLLSYIDTPSLEEARSDELKQMKQIWEDMNSSQDYKLMVLRLEPTTIKGTKINGYLKTFHLPITIPHIIEEIGITHGGGKYQIRIIDSTGKYVRSKTFEISGLPKIPKKDS